MHPHYSWTQPAYCADLPLLMVLADLKEVEAGCVLSSPEVWFLPGKGLCLVLSNLRYSAPVPPIHSPFPSQQTKSHTLHTAQPPPCQLHWTGSEKSPHSAHFWSICPDALTGNKSHHKSFPLADKAAACGSLNYSPFKESLCALPLRHWVTLWLSPVHETSPKSHESLIGKAGHGHPLPSNAGADNITLSLAFSWLTFVAEAMGVLHTVCVCAAWVSMPLCIQVTPGPGLWFPCPGIGGSWKLQALTRLSATAVATHSTFLLSPTKSPYCPL